MPLSGMGFGKTPRTRMLPVVGSTWLSTKFDGALVGKAVLALETHRDG